MQRWQIIAKKGAYLLLGVVAGAALLLGILLRTPPGHAVLAWIIERTSDGAVTITGLSGKLPNDVHAAAVEVGDEKGAWLRLEDVSVDWAALSGLTNHIAIRGVRATRIVVLRRPIPSAKSDSTSPQIDIETFALPRIEIGKAVAGRAAILRAGGSLHYISAHQQSADLLIARLDTNDRYRLKGSIDHDVANGTASISEGANGILGALLGLPGLSPINLDLRAAGTSAANRVALHLSAGKLRASGKGTIALASSRADIDFLANAPAMQVNADLSWQALALEGHVHGAFDAPQIDAKLQLKDAKASGFASSEISGQVRGSNGVIDLATSVAGVRIPGKHPDLFMRSPVAIQAQVNLKAATAPADFAVSHALISVKGHANINGPMKLSASATIPALTPFAALSGQDIRGSASVGVTVSQENAGAQIALNSRMKLEGPSTIARLLGRNATLTLATDLQGSDFLQSQITLQGAGIKMKGGGTFRSNRLDYSIDTTLSDLSLLTKDLIGSAWLSGRIAGPLGKAQAKASGVASIATKGFAKQRVALTLSADGFPNPVSAQLRLVGKYDGSPVTARADMALAKDRKNRIAKLNTRWRSLNVDAVLNLPETGPISGSAKFVLGQIADLTSFAGIKAAGSATAALELKPRRKLPVASVQARIAHFTFASAKAETIAVNGEVSNPLSATPNFAMDLSAQNLDAAGIKGNAQARIDGPPAKLAVALKMALHDLAGQPVNLSGDVSLDAIKKRAIVERLTADWRKQTLVLRAPATIDFAQGLAVDHLVAAAAAGGEIQLAGRVLPKLAASVSLHDMQASALQAWLPQFAAEGTVSATAQLSGTLQQPQGTVSLKGRGLRIQHYSSRAVAPANLDLHAVLQGKSATVDARLAVGKTAQLGFKGEVPLDAAGPLKLQANGSADMAMFNPLVAANGRQVRGMLAVDAAIAGSMASPRINGSAKLTGGEVQDFARGVRIDSIEASAVANGDKVNITNLTARAGPGTLTGSGAIDLAAPGTPLDFTLAAHNARPIVSDLMTATLSGNLKLAGKLSEQIKLTGDVDIVHGEINLPERFPAEIAVLNVRRRGQAPPPPRSEASLILDVTAKTSGQIFVRGHGVESDLGGSIHVTGTSNTPIIGGGFDMNRGTLTVAGQTLVFTTGKVTFDGTGVRNRLDPTLDFVAQTTSGGVTATLTVGGYASALKIALSSTPQLPQDEILSRLLFQQGTKQLTAFQLVQIVQAIAALGGVGGGFDPVGRLRKGLGLDRLSVGSTTSGIQTQTTLEAGKYVARNIYVGAKQNLSGGTQAQVQVDLTKNLKAQATLSTTTNATATTGNAAQDNGSSVGLSYEFEY